MPPNAPPLVLCLSGHDPTGGAGVQADLEAVAANGAHALSLITALTVQDSRDVARVLPVPVASLREQFERLCADARPAAVKIGLIGDREQVPLLAEILQRLQRPAVLDPVLRAGGGTDLVGRALQDALLEQLLPHLTLLTPNAAEARRLAPAARTLDDCAQVLIARGCANVLITGGDEPGPEVVNTWHRAAAAPQVFRWPRLPETFHGAGCTLASAIAAQLARGEPLATALEQAQRWTQAALGRAFAVGGGRRIPGRWPR